jgi:propanediol dehydratase small subunit
MKYIIKNCPALRFPLKENPICSKMPFDECCKDITDCLLKRIADKCYKATHEDLAITADYKKTALDVAEIYGRASLAQEIAQLLEIEECE